MRVMCSICGAEAELGREGMSYEVALHAMEQKGWMVDPYFICPANHERMRVSSGLLTGLVWLSIGIFVVIFWYLVAMGVQWLFGT